MKKMQEVNVDASRHEPIYIPYESLGRVNLSPEEEILYLAENERYDELLEYVREFKLKDKIKNKIDFASIASDCINKKQYRLALRFIKEFSLQNKVDMFALADEIHNLWDKNIQRLGLKELLTMSTTEPQIIKELFASIGENPKILWYPSAGSDFRDIVELTKINNVQNIASDCGLIETPALFIHTDIEFPDIDKNKIIKFKDKNVILKIDSLYKLNFVEDSPFCMLNDPDVYLLNFILIAGKKKIKRSLIYFQLENTGFLKNILLKHHVKASYVVIVMARGYNAGDISPFFPIWGTEFVITDRDINKTTRVAEIIAKDYKLKFKKYKLIKVKTRDWIVQTGARRSVDILKIKALVHRKAYLIKNRRSL